MSREQTTDYEQAVAYLERRAAHGLKPGLERISGLLATMGDPHLGYPVVHVAGTNGKTSTARIAGEIIEVHGLGVGTFTSPPLERPEEAYSVHGRAMTSAEFASAMTDVAPFVDLFDQSGDSVTQFELQAALAFAWFADQAVNAVVVEAGLGGRLDATNVVSAQVAVVTGVSLDHVEYLGSTTAAIAGEKVAILDQGAVLVTGAATREVEAVFAARVEEMASTWRRFDTDFRIDAEVQAVGGWSCDIEGVYKRYEELYLPMHGRYQLRNLAVAVAACEELFGRALDAEAVRVAVGRVTVPGRLEVARRSPLVVVDAAHNPEGVAALADALDEEFLPAEWSVVFGARGSRDVAEMLNPMRGSVGSLYATQAEDHQAIAAEDVAGTAREVFGPGVAVHVRPTVGAAVSDAVDAAGESGAVLVTGSLYVVGEARTHLGHGTAPAG